jgi:CBS domain-containing protein
MKASDIMTRTVITVDEQAPIAEALRLMLGKAISGLPVVDFNNQLVGIITEGDFLRRAELAMERPIAPWKTLLFGPWSSAQEYVRTHARTVGSVMTRETLCIAEDTPLSMIVRMMEQGHVKRLPVTKDGKVIGIVSRRDVLQPLSSVVGDPLADPATDASILQQIEQDLAAQPWTARHNITVNVKDGVVALTGTVSGFEQREALQILIQDIAGVRKICDQLLVVSPHLDSATDSRRTPKLLRQPPNLRIS